jgi:hypothetical protein
MNQSRLFEMQFIQFQLQSSQYLACCFLQVLPLRHKAQGFPFRKNSILLPAHCCIESAYKWGLDDKAKIGFSIANAS